MENTSEKNLYGDPLNPLIYFPLEDEATTNQSTMLFDPNRAMGISTRSKSVLCIIVSMVFSSLGLPSFMGLVTAMVQHLSRIDLSSDRFTMVLSSTLTTTVSGYAFIGLSI